MHEGVYKSTIIDDNLDDRVELGDLCDAIHSRMPLLTHLKVDMFPHPKYLTPLTGLIKSLPNLTSVELPAFDKVSKILPAVLSLSRLRIMKFNAQLLDKASNRVVAVTDIGPYIDSLDVDTRLEFPLELQEIEIYCVSFTAAVGFFRFHGLSDLVNLRKIDLVSNIIEKPSVIRDLFKALSQTCRQITHLEVTYTQGLCSEIMDDQVENPSSLPVLTSSDIVSFADIRHLLGCTEMVNMNFIHPYGLDITDEDVTEMATAWPKLRYAGIGSYPARRIDRGIVGSPSFRSFFTFVEKCPFIESIYLLVNTTIPFAPPTTHTVPHTLRIVGVGLSEIQDGNEYSVALLLSKLCGPRCTLTYDVEERFTKLKQKAFRDRWEAVTKLLPLINGLEARIGEIVEEKEKEILDLKRELALAREIIASRRPICSRPMDFV
ncbi:hypothetical protein VKT23_013721 [Stygiomarasmius scandens]|uniref:F-box domain-containing protein n=1 Tax=Marasmiellus scandens TaxID=2682957 RepID=A0ABR1J2A5_9AGAR